MDGMDFGAWALLPSLLAIGAALLTRQVYVALFLGVWSGAWILGGQSFDALLTGILRVADTHLLHALAPTDGSGDHMSVVLFTILTGGMIGVISRNGGMIGIAHWLAHFAGNRRRGQAATAAMGGLVFFDDYANTLIVGHTMRPLTDRLGISREKLAYLVDSTAAPLACIAIATTWIGFEVSLIEDALPGMALSASAFEMMLGAIPYSFYPILTLLFIAMLIVTGRDFGPMLGAERRASLQGGAPAGQEGTWHATDVMPRGINALLPILTLIGGTIGGLYVTGEGSGLHEVLGSADPFKAILWGAMLGALMAVVISLLTGALTLVETMEAFENGTKPMLSAVMILTFAWAIADINMQLQTADYIVSGLGDGLSAEWLPAMIFLVAAATSFATGSSWGTMGILVPLVLPLAVALLGETVTGDAVAGHAIMLASIASVLSGAVFGDHCSPISDTTILSSIASRCHHIAHVRTQMPYAIVVALAALVFGVLPASFGVPWWLALLAGALALYAFLRSVGRPVALPSS